LLQVGPNLVGKLGPNYGSKIKDSKKSTLNSAIKHLSGKAKKYQKKGRVFVSIDARAHPWMDATELRRRISQKPWTSHLDEVHLIKGGNIERVWPPEGEPKI
jgi:hypothetical protein